MAQNRNAITILLFLVLIVYFVMNGLIMGKIGFPNERPIVNTAPTDVHYAHGAYSATRIKEGNTSATKSTTNNFRREKVGSDTDGDPGSPAFEWDYLDMNQSAICGTEKCLFRSIRPTITTNRNPPSNCDNYYHTGYLVSKSSDFDEAIFDGWKILQYLTKKFGIKHFYLEPPIQMTLHESTAKVMFQQHKSKSNRRRDLDNIYGELFRSGGPITTTSVQKIQIAPPTWELRSTYYEQATGKEQIHKGLENLIKRAASSCGGTPLSVFVDRLDAEISKTFDLLSCEPLLATDFQVKIDLHGNIHHIDIDRVCCRLCFYKYNQTQFDAKLLYMLKKSRGVLSTAQRWVRDKRKEHTTESSSQRFLGSSGHEQQRQQQGENPSTKYTEIKMCGRDWKAEQSTILSSKSLPCLAMERVAMIKNTTTSSMNAASVASTTEVITEQNKGHYRLRHPMLVALLRRVIEDGFYGTHASARGWNCNVYGDRVLRSLSLN